MNQMTGSRHQMIVRIHQISFSNYVYHLIDSLYHLTYYILLAQSFINAELNSLNILINKMKECKHQMIVI
jgi:hypothetical protein